MKKALLLLVMFLSIFYLNAQCPTGSVLLESQTDVDDFVATYSTTCSDIPFDLEIKGNGILEDGINDVSGLDFITSIGGDLYFNNNHDLISINGFNNLTSIGGSFKYYGSYQGTNQTSQVGSGTEEIIGFNNLVSIGGDFWIKDGNTNISISTPIEYSPSLEEINGFNSVTTIGGDIKFDYMDTPNMTGFNALTSFSGNFNLYHNEFPDDGNYNLFPNMPTFDGDIVINRNTYYVTPVYTSLNFLNNINLINGNIDISNMTITSGLPNLVTLNGSLILSKCIIQESFLSSIDTIEYSISMRTNAAGPPAGIGSINIPSLRRINGSLSGNFATCTGITLDNLEFLGNIYLTYFNTATIRMNSLTSLGSFTTDGDVQIEELSMNSLTEVDIPNLNTTFSSGSIDRLYVNSATTYNGDGDLSFVNETLEMNSLETINNLSVKAINLSFESLQNITGDFSMIDGNGGTFDFQNLLTIGGDFNIYNVDVPLDLSSFTNLHNIGSDMIITYNSGLTSLEDLSNIAQVDGFITIRFNENLQDCTALCNYVLSNSNYTISDNSNSCAGTLNTCTINEINGIVRQSLDNIDCTNGSYTPENIQVTATDGTNSYTSFTNENGEYTIILPEGDYTLSVVLPSTYFDASPASQALSIVGTDNVETVDFCLIYNTLIDDVTVTIIPLNEARPGFSGHYSVVYENKGTVIQDGSVSLSFDDFRVAYNSSTETPTTQNTNTISWNYANLFPNEVRSFEVTFDVFPPPTNDSGNILIYTANITPTVDDINIDDNEFILREVMVNSYDPNDKRVLEGEHLLIDDVDEYLYYVIRFQNLGTASAINIRVRDIMSDLIDWDTFQPIEASHDYRVELATGEDQKLEFIFDNINLPDSTTDEEGSHGYVAFKVKPKSTVQVGDLLHNRAAIYFDFNAPIITNETETRIVEDTDSDTIYNYLDNCPNEPNTGQADLDGDGMGDVCDDDSDGDGIPNVDDTCPLIADSNNNDFDEDGIGDICDDDDDNDGILDVNDDCPYYAGTTVDGCPFYLPTDNFVIETTSETCVNQNNAKINIKAASVNNYEVSVTLNGAAIVIPVNTFTQELDIENLSAGTYELCISIPAENYEQCFTLEIEDPATLNANSALSRSNEYSLDLIGAINYSIFINGEEFTINAPDENTLVTFTKQLSAPVNNIEVKTEKECQGKYTEVVKTIENLEFTIVPNPTNGDIFITSIFGDEETNGTINIYDLSGRLISTQVVQFPMQNKRIKVNNLTVGVYFVILNTDNYNNTKKLIKK